MTGDPEHVVIVDATAGADDGLAALRAAAAASVEFDQHVIVVGDESDITAALADIAHDAERLSVMHAADRFPAAAISQTVLDVAPRSAVPVGLRALASHPNASFVTAGQPGAVVRAAHSLLHYLPGVDRTALAAVVPTLRFRGEHDDPFALVLDVGAHARGRAPDLVAYARLGAAYSRLISSNPRPSVALLSHTRNAAALPRELAAAHAALAAPTERFEYIGLIRADRVPLGDADVVVTDGFAGNVVIRMLEGVAATAEQLLARARARFTWRVGVSMLGSGVERLRTIADWENYGGAPLLGVDRTVIVTHEEAGETPLLNAIRLAAKIERLGVRDALVDAVRTL